MSGFVFEMRLVPYPWNLSLWTDHAAMCRAGKRMDPGFPDICVADGRTVALFDKAHVFVGVFNGSSATLVHELTHVLMRLFECIGIPLSPDSNETAAYFMAHVYQECIEALNSHASAQKRIPSRQHRRKTKR